MRVGQRIRTKRDPEHHNSHGLIVSVQPQAPYGVTQWGAYAVVFDGEEHVRWCLPEEISDIS